MQVLFIENRAAGRRKPAFLLAQAGGYGRFSKRAGGGHGMARRDLRSGTRKKRQSIS